MILSPSSDNACIMVLNTRRFLLQIPATLDQLPTMAFFHPLCGSLIKIRCYKGITINRMLQPFDHGIYYWLRLPEIGICNPHGQRIWISYSWSYIIPFRRTSIMPVDHFIKIVFHLVVLLRCCSVGRGRPLTPCVRIKSCTSDSVCMC